MSERNVIHGEGPIYPNGPDVGDEWSLTPDEWMRKYPPGSLPVDYELMKALRRLTEAGPFKGYRPTPWHEMLTTLINEGGGRGKFDEKGLTGWRKDFWDMGDAFEKGRVDPGNGNWEKMFEIFKKLSLGRTLDSLPNEEQHFYLKMVVQASAKTDSNQ